MRWISMVAAGLAMATPVQAQTPPEGFSWYVLDALNRFYLDIDDPTNRPALETEVPEGVLVPVEINGDGRTDWLINWPESAQFCGTGGCQRSLYISAEDGFTRAFDRQTLELTIAQVDGETRIEAWVHHLNCESERAECRFAWAWDETLGRLVERPSSDGVTLLHGGPAVVIDYGEDNEGSALPPPDLPDVLSTLWTSSRIQCAADWTDSGYIVRRTDIVALPDLTGDGLLEWRTQEPGACDADVPPPAQVWTSQVDGNPILSLTAASGERVSVDLVQPRQLVLAETVCGEGEACRPRPARRLVWRESERRFVEVR